MIYNPVNEVNQSNFFLLIFLKKYRRSTTVLLIWKHRHRGTNFAKVPSTGTAVLLQSTVPTYALSSVIPYILDFFQKILVVLGFVLIYQTLFKTKSNLK